MLYALLYPLADHIGAFNVIRYITFRTGGAVMTAMLISFLVGPALIRWLKRKQREGQPIRLDGPESHLLTKKGTPTMGGLMFLLSASITTLLWADLANIYVWVVLFVTIGYGSIGFADDFLKLTKRNTKGLNGRFKLIGQALIGVIATVIVVAHQPTVIATDVALPFFKDVLIPLGYGFVVFGALVMMGASNAVNLTDGLDGLATVPVMITAACFALIAYLVGNQIFAEYLQLHFVPGSGELAVFCGALCGAGLGFLWFNRPPARVFMGDGGSLVQLEKLAVEIPHSTKVEILRQIAATVAPQKVLVFVEFRETARDIGRQLGAMVVHGGLEPAERSRRLSAFRDRSEARILIVTPGLSEGLNLQFCSVLVNYDLPWNPMRIEQRIGRIQRLGQVHKSVRIYSLAAAATIEETIRDGLVRKLRIFEQVIGRVSLSLDSVGGSRGLEVCIREILRQASDEPSLRAELQRVFTKEAEAFVARADLGSERLGGATWLAAPSQRSARRRS